MSLARVATHRRSVLLIARWLVPLACLALLAACGSSPKRGGYYQGDGPPDRAPSDLADAADAVPRVETLNARANRPYTVFGRTYTPLTADVPFRQRGTASWYGRQFHGNRTASGEVYDMFAMTAAHPTLPLPSYARVTNLRSGRSVIVRVNDRGPFKDDRAIDLSYGAATRLGIVGQGTGEVEIERLTFAQIASGEWRRDGPAVTAPALASTLVPSTGPPRWSVQIGAFSQQAPAEAMASRAAAILGFADGELSTNEREARVERDGGLFRVLVGTLPDRGAAVSLAQQLERLLGSPALPYLR